MNLSGTAVRYWLQKLHLPPEQLLVISDDLNIPFGDIRFRLKGSSGGHNGLENIIALLGTDAFARIRVGIGNDFSLGGQIGYVLGNLSEEELKSVDEMSGLIVKGIEEWVTIGTERAMNTLNIRQKH